MFYVWYDDTPKKETMLKIDDAVNAYIARFTTRPNLVLVNEADVLARTDLTVRIARTVQPNSFWLSFEDSPPEANVVVV